MVPRVGGSSPLDRPIFSQTELAHFNDDALGFNRLRRARSIHFITKDECGLRAIVAIHSTHLGPAAGGARFWHYAKDEDALVDALRLSRGMSYKNAMAGLPLGGGKSVILASEERTKIPISSTPLARRSTSWADAI